MKTRHRFMAAFMATTTIHAALVGALMQSQSLKPSSSKAQEVAMIDIVEPEPEAAKPAPAPPVKKILPPQKKPEPTPKPKPVPTPKPVVKPQPKPKPLPKPEPLPKSEPNQDEIIKPISEPTPPKEEEKVEQKPDETPSEASVSTHRYEVSESYLGRLRQKIQACLHYPMMARRLGLEGETQLRFVIRADGTIAQLTLKHSSGHHSLDKQAMATVQNAAPFEAPPEGRELDIVLPVSFSLEQNG
jgi:periplasmic protein TonB